jgi:hypothetical protein
MVSLHCFISPCLINLSLSYYLKQKKKKEEELKFKIFFHQLMPFSNPMSLSNRQKLVLLVGLLRIFRA